MTSVITTYGATAFLNVFRATNITAPVQMYLGLFTADPTISGSLVNEVSGGSYAREAVSFNAPAGTPIEIDSSATITYTTATASWGTITHWGVIDVITLATGNMWAYGAWDSSVPIGIGGEFRIAAGEFILRVTA